MYIFFQLTKIVIEYIGVNILRGELYYIASAPWEHKLAKSNYVNIMFNLIRTHHELLTENSDFTRSLKFILPPVSNSHFIRSENPSEYVQIPN